ncbi:YbhB/YbcL family Raf kinase inhibitor-like protein [Mangrovicoccus sp. HB161399]|uniref:YbhB/YbcL family Raf kinase inhibitor-like protein n=1 Tax=Mangrovicoccus sp. HB161399 TaxID=2720392 RepID=UPI001551D1B4|nr:YbhB/YbcL family Raf kinase inhibitor-like protein [Mangrovicoccus sp. HB161399]
MLRSVPFALALAAAAPAAAFDLSSSDFEPGGELAMEQVADVFGCTGGNVSPALSWSDPPEGTKSFALMVHDPDAPTGGAGFWHWIVLDIPASATGLASGAGAADGTGLPEGARMIPNDYGAAAWGGPCPPEGDSPHRYNFTLYALEGATSGIAEGASTAVAGFLVNAAALGTATLTGMYGH